MTVLFAADSPEVKFFASTVSFFLKMLFIIRKISFCLPSP